AGKGWYYEGGVRVPLIIRWPGKTKAGVTTDSYVISTDHYPTILEMAGLKLKPAQHVDGRSCAPLLQGESQPARRPIYWHYPHYGNQGGRPFSAIRDGDWKLIEFLEDGRSELYDIAHDEAETKNLAAAEPERTAMLLNQLHLWREAAKVQMP